MRKLSELIDEALRHHRDGRLQAARDAYEKLLQIQPDQVDALHMLGVLDYQEGDYEGAISLLERARDQIPHHAGLYINLGNALSTCGRLDESVAAIQKAIEINPGFAMAYNNLGNVFSKQGKLDQSLAAFKKALRINRDYTDAYVNLAAVYQTMGDSTRATKAYAQAVKLDPRNKSAAHMLAALRGETTNGSPLIHVKRLFDEYAERFDHHLVDVLGYSMPGEFRREIDRQLGQDAHFPVAIDLGCGTGLAGVAFRDICGRIVGIDLSSRMIEMARKRGIYDELHNGDVVTVLEADHSRYDFLICADVFPYIGNVQPLFAAIRSHAREGALFAFSTELETEADFVLRQSGRYAHSQKYLCAVSAELGFSVMTARTVNLRKQKGGWILGDLVVLRYHG